MNPYGTLRLYGEAPESLGRAELAWQDEALCAQVDPEIFYVDKGGSIREAVQVCRSCAVRVSCLKYAVERGEMHGIWGGFSDHARRAVARAHQAGRSLKDIIDDDDAEFYARQEAMTQRHRAGWRDRAAANRAAVAATRKDKAA